MINEQQDKLNRFIGAVNIETDNQVKQIIDEANEEKNTILSVAKANAESAKERHITDNIRMEKNRCMRIISKAEFDMKKEILMQRDKLTDELFADVVEKIVAFKTTSDYFDLLVDRITKAGVNADSEVCLAPSDIALVDKLKKATKVDFTVIEDDSIKYGGCYVINRASSTVSDLTFDCAIKEQRTLFASKNVMLRGEERV